MVFDVDGVISSSATLLSKDGIPQRTLNVKDSFAIQLAVKNGFIVGVISGGFSQPMYNALTRLGVKNIYMHASDKTERMQHIMKSYDLSAEQILYMGDDMPDMKALLMVALPCCPDDAAHEVKSACRYISEYRGGMGCVRDVIEQVLRANDMWLKENSFVW